MTPPVTFQIVVHCHPDEYHLFEMDYEENLHPRVGMLIVDVPGIPKQLRPDAGFDNKIFRLAWDGKRKRTLVQLMSLRWGTDLFSEVLSKLPEWKHIRQLREVNDPTKPIG